ncbi:MAG: CYTH domain-containing protein [Spirochaetaceae bacterium]|jgi:predicted adenylyl cyclase CyaB|nr:CYTH domain-containing protein [Spirochaetaceae bacterium]
MGNNTEIEVKARIEDQVDCKARLEGIAGKGTAFIKEDSYWFLSPERSAGEAALEGPGALPPSGLRVRRERYSGGEDGAPEQIWVTYKIRKSSPDKRDIEVNDEHEFEVSDGSGFEDLLVRLGLKKGVCKRKRGWKWKYENICAELAEVDGAVLPEPSRRLGWFVELEVLSDPAEAEFAAVKAELLEFLARIGIPEEKIEPRYYSQLLFGKG